MKKYFEQTARLVQMFNVKNKRQYKRLMFNYAVLSLQSLQYITNERNHKKILRILREIQFQEETQELSE